MLFPKLIHDRRVALGLGVREAARQTVLPYVPSPIKSAVYISRLESGNSADMPVQSVTIDKCWALGAVLRIHPFSLFLSSRERDDLIPHLADFPIRECTAGDVGQFLRARRAELGLSMREAADLAEPWHVSLGYWSQIETDFRECGTKISGEKLWGMGVALGIDPALLYVLSRRMDARYLKAESRDRLFR